MSILTIGVVAEQVQWFDGAPLSVPSDAVAIDVRSYRRMTCAGCGKRGMRAEPQHSTTGRYRIKCSCRQCRHVQIC